MVTRVLVQCPNLNKLRLITPQVPVGSTTREQCCNAITNRMNSFLSHLTRLRHLHLVFHLYVTEERVAQALSKLPHLENFQVSRVVSNHSLQENDTMAYHLARLEYLTCLSLSKVTILRDSWLSRSWPKLLNTLSIRNCPHLTPEDAFTFITLAAPNVTRLELGFLEGTSAEESDIAHQSAGFPHYRLQLPLLTHLNLFNHPNCDMSNFKDCQAIQTLTYHHIIPTEWPVFAKEVCKPNWPHLKDLHLDVPREYDYAEWDIIAAQEDLRRYSSGASIKLRMPFDGL